MFTGFRAPAVAAFAILTSLTVGSVSAQELSAPGQISLPLQQKVATSYLVTFDDSVDPNDYRRNAASIASRFGGRVIHTYRNVLPGFAMRIDNGDGANLLRAAGQFGIASVTRDFIMSINARNDNNPGSSARPCEKDPSCTPDESNNTTATEPEAGWNIQRVGVSSGNDYSGFAIKACVIDTGIYRHSELNVVAGRNIIAGSDDANDDNGHGTHVAGIIGAKRNSTGVEGVAPGVKVVPIKVLDGSGSGSWLDVIAGVDWAAGTDSNVPRCTVANLSLGGLAYNWDTGLEVAIHNAAAKGVKFSIAAGNSSVDIIGPSYGYTPARASTGVSDNIFTIASTAEPNQDGDVWSSFSNYNSLGSTGGRVDFALPGQSIKSTWNNGGYNTISGTSMAAPHMAGLLVRHIAADTDYTANTDIDDNEIMSGTGTVTRTIRVREKRDIVTYDQSDVYNVIGPNPN